MGGKALKNCITNRYNKEDFLKMMEIVKRHLYFVFPNKKIATLDFFFGKETFGDLDVLVSCDDKNDINLIIDTIKETFIPTEMILNGTVLTFNILDFQIDLILTPTESFEMAKVYYSWNDSGMMIGRMAHSLGYRYTPNGLCLFIYTDDRSSRLCTFVLTKDPNKIFEILDLDFAVFQKGFYDSTELFEYLSKSKYFKYDVFDSKLITSEDRRRDNKRTSIHLFKKWLELNQSRLPRQFTQPTQDEVIKFTDKLFPEQKIIETIQYNKNLEKIKKDIHNKWNGNIIKERYPYLDPRKLGESIKAFDYYFKENNISYDSYILNNDIDTIFKLFNEIINEKN